MPESDTDHISEGSEGSSVNSFSVGVDKIKGPSLFNEPQLNPLTEALDESPVSKLLPEKPVISSVGDTVLSVAQMLTNKRSDASLIVDESGALAGIITDTDISRRAWWQSTWILPQPVFRLL